MDTVSLKKYIFENQKVEHILESIGCHGIKYHKNKEFYSCGNYNGDNIGAINVRNDEYLSVVNWTREKDFDNYSDIIDLVQYNKKLSFVNTVKYIHKLLGLKYTPYNKDAKKYDEEEVKIDPLAIFMDAKKRAKRKSIGVDDIDMLDEDLINDYIPMLHISWFKEGIMPWTRDKFGLAYSYKYKRVIIPFHYWLDGSLMGFNQRTTVENYNELGIRKYFITPSYKKSINLYGLYENIEEIESKRICVIFESEKSVLKRHSRGDGTCIALSGHTLSLEQRRIISGLDIDEVVVCLDNDVSIEEIWHMCNKLYIYGSRKVSYIYDKMGFLGDKECAADKHNEIYKYLFNHRVLFDEKMRKKYVNSLKKKQSK